MITIQSKHNIDSVVYYDIFIFLQAIQRRLSGNMNFNKTWTEFKNGFGDPANAYWIGQ